MKTPKEDGKHPSNTELLKQQAAACGPGCGCHAGGAPGKMRWVIGTLVLVAAGVMVVRAMVKTDGPSTQASATTFADPVASKTAAGTGGPTTALAAAAPAIETSVGTTIGAFAELNTLTANADTVFIFVPGKDGTSGNPPSTPMKGAARMIESQGRKCGLFTLKAGSRDYNQVAAQVSLPAVLALVKGGGMNAISGDITETKIVQGFLAASRSGGCGPASGGCAPGACK